MTTTKIEVRVYCGTYAKYNNGSIFGDWFDLSDYSSKEDLYKAFAELHKDEDDPEYMFQDYEVPELLKSMIGESWMSDDLFTAIEALENADHDIEMYEAFQSCFGDQDSIEQLIENADSAFQGKYDSDEDFAQQLAEDCGMVSDDAKWPYTCIDWEQAARELMYDYSGDNGYYFNSNW